jgi:hypothetical protein
MTAKRRQLIFCGVLGLGMVFQSSAQGVSVSDTTRIPANYKPQLQREIRHDAIDKEQELTLTSDDKKDGKFTPTQSEEINFILSKALVQRTDILQYLLETDAGFDHRLKVKYLYGLENLLKFYRQHWKLRGDRRVNAVSLPMILTAYEESVGLDRKGKTIEGIVDALPYDAALTLMNADIFENNPGYQKSQHNVIRKYCVAFPDRTFYKLYQNPDVPFADSLVRARARKYPRQLYDFAAASNKLGAVIRNIKDDEFIVAVARMARSKSGQQYFPFLDNIVNGKMTIEQIDAIKDDPLAYYRLLVSTQMDYVKRAINRDTAFEFAGLTSRLEKKAREDFVNVINGLHNEPAEIRFRIIQPLTAPELYYLAVSSDGSIYTSSFVKGVYPLMMKKSGNRGDSLLMQLNFDRYRKFIKMAAGYNTLSDFLASFPAKRNPEDESDAEKLMKAFVGRLEQGNGLEDGVDVADSYASIAETLEPIAKDMIRNIEINYKRNEQANNKRGMAIYRILSKLFLSADSTNKIDLTKELGIPPVYEVPYKNLLNDSGRAVMHVFFYGDKDGQGIFRGFVGMFSNSNWKITGNDYWVHISSVKGLPVSIYANRALPEEGGEDEKAQKALGEYMHKNKIFPSVTIHRGHSYYADATIAQMFPSSRIVFLGSCGGYHLVHDVLAKAPDAHIIASKQIGATEVNRPFFSLLTEKVRNGQNIEWISFWKELDRMVSIKEFEDYIPPYKNLGALFIKAYKIAMGDDGQEDE